MMKIFSKILAVLALSSFCFAINLEPLENACKSGNENMCKAVGAIKDKIADCDSGLAEACFTLGLSVEQGSLGYVHLPTARKYHQKGCDFGNSTACVAVGITYAKEGNLAAAFRTYQKACANGNALACANEAYMHMMGESVPKNEKKAIQLYEKSCAANNDLGCNGLGAVYANGLGVSQDMQKAKDYFKKACDLNYKEGCDNYKRLQ